MVDASPPVTARLIASKPLDITYTGSWKSSGETRQSSAPNSALTFRFAGTNFAWIAAHSRNLGAAEIHTDGEYFRTVDLHASDQITEEIVANGAGTPKVRTWSQ
jgi:hypothetical protein